MEILIRKHIGFHIKVEVFVATAGPDQKLEMYVCQEKQQDITSSRFGENGSTKTVFSPGHLSPSSLCLLLSRYIQELYPNYSMQ